MNRNFQNRKTNRGINKTNVNNSFCAGKAIVVALVILFGLNQCDKNVDYTHVITINGNIPGANYRAWKNNSILDSNTADNNGNTELNFTNKEESTPLDSITGKANGYNNYNSGRIIISTTKTIYPELSRTLFNYWLQGNKNNVETVKAYKDGNNIMQWPTMQWNNPSSDEFKTSNHQSPEQTLQLDSIVFASYAKIPVVIKDTTITPNGAQISKTLQKSPITISGHTINTSKAYTTNIEQLKEAIPFIILNEQGDTTKITPNTDGSFSATFKEGTGNYLFIIDQEDYLKTSHVFELEKLDNQGLLVPTSPHENSGRERWVNRFMFGQSVMGMKGHLDKTFSNYGSENQLLIFSQDYEQFQTTIEKHIFDLSIRKWTQDTIKENIIQAYMNGVLETNNELKNKYTEDYEPIDSTLQTGRGRLIISSIIGGGPGGHTPILDQETKRVVGVNASIDPTYYESDIDFFGRIIRQEIGAGIYHQYELFDIEILSDGTVERSAFYASGGYKEYTMYGKNAVNLCSFLEDHINSFQKEENVHKTYFYPVIAIASDWFYHTNPDYKAFVDKNAIDFQVEQHFGDN